MAGENKYRELRERLEAASGPDREIDVWMHAVLGFDTPRVDIYFPEGTLQHWWKQSHLRFGGAGTRDPLRLIRPFTDPIHEVPTYTSSLDAALALVERKLPGWGWQVHSKSDSPHNDCFAFLGEDVADGPAYRAYAKTPALALCLALLRAVEALDLEDAE